MTENEQIKFYQLLGERIKNARTQTGLKQEAFASYLNLSRASIVNIEKGRQHPPIHLLFVIAKVLNIEVTQLLPVFSASDEKVSSILIKLVTEQTKGDKGTKKKIMGFIEELQSSKNI
jgi:transcriptional regulator with XRE-family HTH domain